MAAARDDFGIPETGLALLRDLIHERTGLFYDERRFDTLADRIAPLVLERGFRSYLDFYYLLQYDEQASPCEWRKVLDALSVQETYFWREVDQILALATEVMPLLIRRAAGQPIQIWSAPCATGEEPLSIAMALDEAGWFGRAAIHIHGSDGSAAAIAKARAGRYRERAFRALPGALRDKYFSSRDGVFTPSATLSSRITSWSVANLLARDEVAVRASAPVIFCRNAFIYFSPQSVRRVVDTFADFMPLPAYLFVGASESLISVTDRFSLEEINGAFVYVKQGRVSDFEK